MSQAAYVLAGYLEHWKCKDFKLSTDALYQLSLGDKIKEWWETTGLNRIELTTTGQHLGFCVVDIVSGTSTDLRQ